MSAPQSRREFLQRSTQAAAGLAAAAGIGVGPLLAADRKKKKPLFKISCTEYSLHRTIAKKELGHLEYA
ncbi:MAG: twin-arginine translocation signal domain-containing protein, partial [Planctomycetaceae bacterium]